MPEKTAAQSLATDILSLYNVREYVDETVDKIYHPDATFHDPALDVKGTENIKALFRSLSSFISQSEAILVRGSVTGTALTVESTVTYRLKPFPKFFIFSMKMFTICELDRGKVIKHSDYWDLKSVIQNIPLLSFFYDTFRPIVGTVSAVLLKRAFPEKVSIKEN